MPATALSVVMNSFDGNYLRKKTFARSHCVHFALRVRAVLRKTFYTQICPLCVCQCALIASFILYHSPPPSHTRKITQLSVCDNSLLVKLSLLPFDRLTRVCYENTIQRTLISSQIALVNPFLNVLSL